MTLSNAIVDNDVVVRIGPAFFCARGAHSVGGAGCIGG